MTSLSDFLLSIGIAPADLGFFACVATAFYLGMLVKEMMVEREKQRRAQAWWRGEKVK